MSKIIDRSAAEDGDAGSADESIRQSKRLLLDRILLSYSSVCLLF
jgi:hypothetical protein